MDARSWCSSLAAGEPCHDSNLYHATLGTSQALPKENDVSLSESLSGQNRDERHLGTKLILTVPQEYQALPDGPVKQNMLLSVYSHASNEKKSPRDGSCVISILMEK